MNSLFSARDAEPADAALILDFIRELAAYEKLSSQVTGTEEQLQKTLFEQKKAHVLIAQWDGEPVGFCLYFYNYSTFLCKPGLYIEDVFVRPDMRGKGIGTGIFRTVARKAATEGCGRVEWNCLDWNEPARTFYRNLGAATLDGWTIHRLDEHAMRAVAEQ